MLGQRTVDGRVDKIALIGTYSVNYRRLLTQSKRNKNIFVDRILNACGVLKVALGQRGRGRGLTSERNCVMAVCGW